MSFVAEDSNFHYLMDRQIGRYYPEWEVRNDSIRNGMRTNQGCLDLLNWYIDLELRYEAQLANWLGLRYRNHFLGDYGNHKTDHFFEPFFPIRPDQRIYLSVTTHYYKGENELGIGYFLGRDYVNCLETFIVAENFDRNFSLKQSGTGHDVRTYRMWPIDWRGTITKNWTGSRLNLKWELTVPYKLESTDDPVTFRETGSRRSFYGRFWKDFSRIRIGATADCRYSATDVIDTSYHFRTARSEILAEPMIGYQITGYWRPTLYLDFNRKSNRDSIFVENNVFAYYIDLEYCPTPLRNPDSGGVFVWHIGTQRQYYADNRDQEYRERRINLSLEYRYRNLWFNLHEAMEGDFPTPKYLHNHTYLQMNISF
jgi:hypothetical protein